MLNRAQTAIASMWICGLVAASVVEAATDTAPVPFPSARYQVRVERGVMIQARDGVGLSTDLYFPEGLAGRLPVVLLRTQYDKSKYSAAARSPSRQVPHMFAGQGFVVAVQDIRGRFESEGEFRLARDDARDGYDTVDWLAQQPWSNGRVGTYGCSSLGITQVLQAPLRHPALRAMVPQAAGGATRRQLWDVVTAGVPEIGWALEWFRDDGYRASQRVDVTRRARYDDFVALKPASLTSTELNNVLGSLPVRDMARAGGGPPNDWVDYVTREAGDPWWDQFGYFSDETQVDVPTLHVNSWYDASVGETLYLFDRFAANSLSARSRNNQFVIIAPGEHCDAEHASADLKVGERSLGDARKGFWTIYLRWLDHWLRQDTNDDFDMPRVQYYLMGKNEWRAAQSWPVPGMRLRNYYLRSGGRANGLSGDGVLTERPAARRSTDQILYDPGNPVPSRGINFGGAGRDQREIEARQDVLVYSTPLLESAVEVTGPVEVVLYVSSSAVDTDFTAKLIDVYPDGTAFDIHSGVARARYRMGLRDIRWLQPGEIYELRIGLQATSNYFDAGHRIRLEVSSSDFPRFERNLNTGADNTLATRWIVARNRVHHGARYPSRLVLPVVPPSRS